LNYDCFEEKGREYCNEDRDRVKEKEVVMFVDLLHPVSKGKL